MPERTTVEKARAGLRAGKSPTTAAGEFVREEIEHIRQGKHGARSPEQAIAIGRSKARRAGVPLKPSRKRTTATRRALKREPKSAASKRVLSRHAKSVARKRKRT